MIFFVGDCPSSKNINPEVAFVGTKSYAVLLSWIAKLDISINESVIVNTRNFRMYNGDLIEIEARGTYSSISHDILESEDKFIALGNNASKFLTQLGIKHFTLAHPSGKNKLLNNKQNVKLMLEDCKLFLKGDTVSPE